MGGLVLLPRYKDNCLCGAISLIVYGYGTLSIINARNNIFVFHVAAELVRLNLTLRRIMWIYTMISDYYRHLPDREWECVCPLLINPYDIHIALCKSGVF